MTKSQAEESINKTNTAWSLLVVGALCLTVTIGAYFAANEMEHERFTSEMEHSSNNYRALFQDKINSYFEETDALKRFFDGSETVNRSEFSAFVSSVIERDKAIKSFVWLPRVPKDLRNSFESSPWELGLGGKKIHANQPLLSDALALFPITYIEPIELGRPAVGFDLSVDPACGDMFKKLATSATSGLSANIENFHGLAALFPDTTNLSLIVQPVYQRDIANMSISADEREKHLRGFLLMVFDLRQSFDESISGTLAGGINIRIVDNGVGAEGKTIFFHKSRSADYGDSLLTPYLKHLSIETRIPLNFSSVDWSMEFEPVAKFYERNYRWQGEVAAIFGLLATAFILFFMYTNRKRFYFIEKIVDERTESLKASKSEQMATLESINDIFFTLNSDWIIVYANPKALDLMGKPLDQVQGKVLWDEYPELSSYFYRPFYQAMKNQKTVEENMLAYPPKDMWFSVKVYPNQSGISVYMLDITQQTKERKQREQAELRTQAILHTAVDGIITINDHGIIQTLNPAAEEIFGYYESEVVGQNVKMLMPEPYHGEHDGYLQNYIRSGKKKIIGIGREVVGLRASGKVFPMDLAVSEMMLGEERHFVGIVRDITERKKQSDELRESQERFQDFAETASDWFWEMDKDLRYSYFSDGFYQRFGVVAEEIMGKSRAEMAGDNIDQNMMDHIETLNKHEPFTDFRYEVSLPNNKVMYVSVNGKPVFDDEGIFTGYHGTASDITERRRISEQLRQSQKMDALGKLAGGVAHEFNNILVGISGFSSMALDDLDNHELSSMCLNEISSAADRAASLTQELLSFSSKRLPYLAVVKLDEQVMAISNFLKTIIDKKIEISYNMEMGNAKIEIDPGQFSQAITNLVINASHAMPDGGKISINAVIPNAERVSRLNRKHSGNITGDKYICLCVSDNGTGMSDETLQHLFEPFFTTKEKGKGTGLGLSMVYGFIEQSNGFIDVESKLGKGTTFHLIFPVSDKDISVDKAESQEKIGLDKTMRALVVDDDEIVRKFIVSVISEAGVEPVLAANGAEGLEIFEKEKDNIDLILTDIVMPKLNGTDMVKKIKEIKPDVKVVFMSGFPGQESTMTPDLLQASIFIEKPFTKSKLMDAIIKMLSK